MLERPTNCFRACVATVFGCPIEDVPQGCDGASWDWDAFQDWLWLRGMQAVEVGFGNGGTIYPVRWPVACILTGKSPRECVTGRHAVVARLVGLEGFEITHDPHGSGDAFVGDPTHAVFFVPIAHDAPSLRSAALALKGHAWLERFRKATYENEGHDISPACANDIARYVDALISAVLASHPGSLSTTDDQPLKDRCKKFLFFGCWSPKKIGHYLYMPDGYWPDREQTTPWGKTPDGTLAPHGPNCREHRCVCIQPEGFAALHHKAGWTAIGFWDRTADTRGNCNGNFFAYGTFTFQEMIELAAIHFPEVSKRCRLGSMKQAKGEGATAS